jgi:hypothetical protein
MAKKTKNTIPSGFEDILGNIYSNAEKGEGVTNIDELDVKDDPVVELEDKNEPPVNKTEDGNADDQNKP